MMYGKRTLGGERLTSMVAQKRLRVEPEEGDDNKQTEDDDPRHQKKTAIELAMEEEEEYERRKETEQRRLPLRPMSSQNIGDYQSQFPKIRAAAAETTVAWWWKTKNKAAHDTQDISFGTLHTR